MNEIKIGNQSNQQNITPKLKNLQTAGLSPKNINSFYRTNVRNNLSDFILNGKNSLVAYFNNWHQILTLNTTKQKYTPLLNSLFLGVNIYNLVNASKLPNKQGLLSKLEAQIKDIQTILLASGMYTKTFNDVYIDLITKKQNLPNFLVIQYFETYLNLATVAAKHKETNYINTNVTRFINAAKRATKIKAALPNNSQLKNNIDSLLFSMHTVVIAKPASKGIVKIVAKYVPKQTHNGKNPEIIPEIKPFLAGSQSPSTQECEEPKTINTNYTPVDIKKLIAEEPLSPKEQRIFKEIKYKIKNKDIIKSFMALETYHSRDDKPVADKTFVLFAAFIANAYQALVSRSNYNPKKDTRNKYSLIETNHQTIIDNIYRKDRKLNVSAEILALMENQKIGLELAIQQKINPTQLAEIQTLTPATQEELKIEPVPQQTTKTPHSNNIAALKQAADTSISQALAAVAPKTPIIAIPKTTSKTISIEQDPNPGTIKNVGTQKLSFNQQFINPTKSDKAANAYVEKQIKKDHLRLSHKEITRRHNKGLISSEIYLYLTEKILEGYNALLSIGINTPEKSAYSPAKFEAWHIVINGKNGIINTTKASIKNRSKGTELATETLSATYAKYQELFTIIQKRSASNAIKVFALTYYAGVKITSLQNNALNFIAADKQNSTKLYTIKDLDIPKLKIEFKKLDDETMESIRNYIKERVAQRTKNILKELNIPQTDITAIPAVSKLTSEDISFLSSWISKIKAANSSKLSTVTNTISTLNQLPKLIDFLSKNEAIITKDTAQFDKNSLKTLFTKIFQIDPQKFESLYSKGITADTVTAATKAAQSNFIENTRSTSIEEIAFSNYKLLRRVPKETLRSLAGNNGKINIRTILVMLVLFLEKEELSIRQSETIKTSLPDFLESQRIILLSLLCWLASMHFKTEEKNENKSNQLQKLFKLFNKLAKVQKLNLSYLDAPSKEKYVLEFKLLKALTKSINKNYQVLIANI